MISQFMIVFITLNCRKVLFKNIISYKIKLFAGKGLEIGLAKL